MIREREYIENLLFHQFLIDGNSFYVYMTDIYVNDWVKILNENGLMCHIRSNRLFIKISDITIKLRDDKINSILDEN